ncbi:MAG TPA: hypothetical protein VF519_07790 [Mycobacteriales bacterium]
MPSGVAIEDVFAYRVRVRLAAWMLRLALLAGVALAVAAVWHPDALDTVHLAALVVLVPLFVALWLLEVAAVVDFLRRRPDIGFGEYGLRMWGRYLRQAFGRSRRVCRDDPEE